ncbi:MAG TPA: hypothetical protein VNI61_02280 [Gemmatimonadales bacterium]|nr:hypothetical protein [Gemmatimonadales bacterium]
MKPTSFRLLVLLVALLLVAAPAEAQRRGRARAAAAAAYAPRFGPHLGYNVDVEELLLGAQLSWPITPRVELYPSFDYYFVDPGSLWSLNADLKLRPPTRYGALYLGAGLNYSRRSVSGASPSETGLNLLVGLEGRRTRTAPYVEAKFIVGDESSFQIVGGFSFR